MCFNIVLYVFFVLVFVFILFCFLFLKILAVFSYSVNLRLNEVKRIYMLNKTFLFFETYAMIIDQSENKTFSLS